MNIELQTLNRGSKADYVLGTTIDGWAAFDVVRWHCIEELSSIFHYDVVLARDAALGPVDIEELVDSGASIEMSKGSIVLNNGAGAAIALIGPNIFVTGAKLVSVCGLNQISGGQNSFFSDGPTTIVGSGGINASGPTIKLNG